MILSKDDVVSQLKQLNKNYYDDNYFRDAFASTALSEQRAQSALDTDYAKAVSQAYATSMSNANSIYGSSLGTGYKEQALAANQNALLDAFNQYKQNYITGKEELRSSYDELNQGIYQSYLDQEERISSQAESFMNYWDEHYNYAQWLWDQGKYDAFNNAELHNFVTTDADGFQRLKTKGELFAPGLEGAFVDTNSELTDAGRHYLDVVEGIQLEGIPTFGEYLYDNNRKMWDWATETNAEYGTNGLGLFKEATGRSGKDYKFNYSTYDYRINEVANKWDTEYVTLTADNVIDTEYFGKDAKAKLESGRWKLSNDTSKTYSPELFEESAKSLTDGQAGKNRTKTVEEVVEAAKNGTLKNGSIVDINRGGGADLWVYWNGKFTKLEKEQNSDDYEYNPLLNMLL